MPTPQQVNQRDVIGMLNMHKQVEINSHSESLMDGECLKIKT